MRGRVKCLDTEPSVYLWSTVKHFPRYFDMVVFSSQGKNLHHITSNVWTHVHSIKHRKNIYIIAQFATNLRDEFFKPNYAMI